MRILVGWDNPEEAELISLYLNNDGHTAEVVLGEAPLLARSTPGERWDVILMSTGAADGNGTLDAFQRIRDALPNCPIVGACRPDETGQLTRFIAAGMQTYVLRDAQGDFVFLLLSTLENTVRAVHAERERLVAEKLRQEIDAVLRFQRAMIPEPLFAPPGFQCAGRYESSSIHVRGGAPVVLAGGDFYETFAIDETRTGLAIADAAGHGMHACLSVTILQTCLQELQEQPIASPSEFVARLNRRFCGHRIVTNQGNLITLLFGILDGRRNEIVWTSAGHPLPILQDRRGGRIRTLGARGVGGPPLGVNEEIVYREFAADVPRRSRIVCYTDGVTEASPEANGGRSFSREGVERTLREMVEADAADTIASLLKNSEEFTEGAGRHDDASILILDRR
ncbi:MAG: PP2C family protein-serine/threonine phosphatase [Planctomycetaceae bacterium]